MNPSWGSQSSEGEDVPLSPLQAEVADAQPVSRDYAIHLTLLPSLGTPYSTALPCCSSMSLSGPTSY